MRGGGTRVVGVCVKSVERVDARCGVCVCDVQNDNVASLSLSLCVCVCVGRKRGRRRGRVEVRCGRSEEERDGFRDEMEAVWSGYDDDDDAKWERDGQCADCDADDGGW